MWNQWPEGGSVISYADVVETQKRKEEGGHGRELLPHRKKVPCCSLSVVGGKLLICVVSVISPAADLSVSSLFVWSQ